MNGAFCGGLHADSNLPEIVCLPPPEKQMNWVGGHVLRQENMPLFLMPIGFTVQIFCI